MTAITNLKGESVNIVEDDIHRIGGMLGVVAIYMQDGTTHITYASLETPYPLRFEHTSMEFLLKIRKSIDSCESVKQLLNLKKFVKMYWDNMMYVGLQGFVAIDLKNQYLEKLKQLSDENI